MPPPPLHACRRRAGQYWPQPPRNEQATRGRSTPCPLPRPRPRDGHAAAAAPSSPNPSFSPSGAAAAGRGRRRPSRPTDVRAVAGGPRAPLPPPPPPCAARGPPRHRAPPRSGSASWGAGCGLHALRPGARGRAARLRALLPVPHLRPPRGVLRHCSRP